jgi:DNA-binding NtrC family response regulator
MPAIIMTGYNNEDMAISAIRKEVAAYIKKPVNLAYLRKRLQEIFSDSGNSGNPEISGTKEFIFDAIANHIEEKYMTERVYKNYRGTSGAGYFRRSVAIKSRLSFMQLKAF